MILIKQEPGYTTQRFLWRKCLTRNKESGHPRWTIFIRKRHIGWHGKSLWDYKKVFGVLVRLLAFIFLTKKSLKIHFTYKSIKILVFLNTMGQFISH
jgi:hypothetical protein